MRDLGIHTEVGMLGSWREGSHILFNSEIMKQFLVHYLHRCIDKSLLKFFLKSVTNEDKIFSKHPCQIMGFKSPDSFVIS